MSVGTHGVQTFCPAGEPLLVTKPCPETQHPHPPAASPPGVALPTGGRVGFQPWGRGAGAHGGHGSVPGTGVKQLLKTALQ